MAARTTFTTAAQGESGYSMQERERPREEEVAYGGRPTVVSVTPGTGTGAQREPGQTQPGMVSVTREASREEMELRRKATGGRRDVEAAEREEEALDVNPPGLHAFTLTYAFLIGLTALGLAVAGGATNYWVSARYIDNTPNGPVASFFHGGFWHTCGPNGCTYISPTKARPFQNASQAFYFGFIFILAFGAIIHLVAMAATRRKAHTDLAKTAGLVFTIASFCGIIAMASYVGKTMNNLQGADSIFYAWSFGLFTAAWAALLGLVVPLCYIATEH